MRLEPWGLVGAMVVIAGCGPEPAGHPETPTLTEPASGERSETEPSEPDEEAAVVPDASEEPAAALLTPDGDEVRLACGRASARLPASFAIDAEGSGCENGGYPMPIEGENFGGGQEHLQVTGRGCELSISTWEVLDPRAEGIETNDGDVVLAVRTPDATTLLTSLRPRQSRDATCMRVAEGIAAGLRQSMSVTPLREPANRAQVQISSSGHGLSLDLPAGYWLFSMGGQADQYETAYRLMGPSDTSATLITAWDPQADPRAPLRRFRPRVLSRPARPAPHDGAWDPITSDPCRRLPAVGPEPRIEVHIDFCGPASGDAALVEVLLDARFTRPPPEAP